MPRRKPMTTEQREKARARNRAYYRRHRDAILAKGAILQKRRWERDGEKLREVARERMRINRAANPEIYRERDRIRLQDPENRRKNNERSRKWLRDNPERARELRRKNKPAKEQRDRLRRVGARRARPSWANQFFMNEAYDLARRRTKAMGIAWHVDHVVPLRSKIVNGLHCEQNLAVVTAISNASKGNRFWPDMP